MYRYCTNQGNRRPGKGQINNLKNHRSLINNTKITQEGIPVVKYEEICTSSVIEFGFRLIVAKKDPDADPDRIV
jgi:hypothetical protein